MEREGIYLAVDFYNTDHLNGIYIEGQYSFTIDPADDLYVFSFDNTEGHIECLVRFRLEEMWTGPVAIGSPPFFFAGLIGFFLFLAGLISSAIVRTGAKGSIDSHTLLQSDKAATCLRPRSVQVAF